MKSIWYCNLWNLLHLVHNFLLCEFLCQNSLKIDKKILKDKGLVQPLSPGRPSSPGGRGWTRPCRFHMFYIFYSSQFSLNFVLKDSFVKFLIRGQKVSVLRLFHGQILVWNSKLPSITAKLPRKMQIPVQNSWSNCKDVPLILARLAVVSYLSLSARGNL